jgi:hypothetical protein
MPTVNMTEEEQTRYHDRPSWLPEEPVQGFDRWYQRPGPGGHHPPDFEDPPDFGFGHDFDSDEERPPPPPPPQHRHRRHHKASYNPVTDPLRITNLDEDILSPISAALKERKIKIKHVVLLALESTRKDVFPIKTGSHLWQNVLLSHNHLPGGSEADEALSTLTPNAELLTGEQGGWNLTHQDITARPGSWRNLAKGQGGLDVVGAFTPSTVSLKSMLGSHCGVQSLAVDFTVEAGQRIYQPCIPHILNFWNRKKGGSQRRASGKGKRKAKEDDITSMPWRSVYVQAITDEFDHQDILNEHVGFSEVIVKNTLLNPESKHYPPTEKQSNYFGFPEPQVKPYLEDLFREAKQNNERLFLSHLTSTTHHPWNLPEGSGESIEYLRRKQKFWGEHPLNRYLNTIKYIDGWLGQVMDIIENAGAADETLVVMVGDQ